MAIHELKSDMTAVGQAKAKPTAVYLMPAIELNAQGGTAVAKAMAEESGEETALLVVKGPGAKAIVEQIKKELDERAATLKGE